MGTLLGCLERIHQQPTLPLRPGTRVGANDPLDGSGMEVVVIFFTRRLGFAAASRFALDVFEHQSP